MIPAGSLLARWQSAGSAEEKAAAGAVHCKSCSPPGPPAAKDEPGRRACIASSHRCADRW